MTPSGRYPIVRHEERFLDGLSDRLIPIYPTTQIRAFIEVAHTSSFTRAAERMHVSQPTVSGLVAALERRTGTPLFVRRPRRVELTASGAALLPHAERALALAAEAAAAVDRASARRRVRLWVAAGEALTTYVLPPAVAELRRRLPRLDTGFVVGDEARVLQALRSGEADAALLTERTAPADLVREPFGEDVWVAIASPQEPVAVEPLELADLAGRVLVVRGAATVDRRELDRVLAEAGVRPAGRLEAHSLEAVKRCVEAGLGVGVVPLMAVRRELAAGVLRRLPMRVPPLRFELDLAWRAGEPAPAAAAAFLDVLRATWSPPQS